MSSPLQARLSRFRVSLDERSRRVVLAAGAGVAQRGVAIIGTFLIYPRVLHALGPDLFGVWGATTSLVLLVLAADFGVGPAIVNLVSHALATGRSEDARDQLAGALIAAAAIAVFILVAGSILAFTVVPRSQLVLYLMAVFGVAINVPLGSANSAWLALQRGWMIAFWEFLQNVLLIGGLIAATLFTRDVRFYVGVVYGALLIASALDLWWLFVRHPELRPARWNVPFARISIVFRTGSRFFILAGFDALSYLFDNTIALQILGPIASAKMAVVQRVCLSAIGILMVVAQPLWPAFVEAAVRGDRRWMFRALARGTTLVTGTAIAGSAVIVLFGGPLLRLWLGTSLGISTSLLWVMAAWIVSLSLVRVQILLLNALRIIDFQIAVFGIATVLAVTLKFVLAPIMGIAGIMLATAVTFPIIVLPAMIWRIGRLRGTDAGLSMLAPENTGRARRAEPKA